MLKRCAKVVFTWWGSIQEKSHLSVTNATTLALLLVTCRDTWGRTVGKNLSGVRNATKLKYKRERSQDITELTRPRFCRILQIWLLIWFWNTKTWKWPNDIREAVKKESGIIWEFFPIGGPPPLPFRNPLFKKKVFILHFRPSGTFLVFNKKLEFGQYFYT